MLRVLLAKRHYRITFFGSDEFSVKALDRLVQLKKERPRLVQDIQVVTTAGEALEGKKKTPVLLYSLENQLKVLNVRKNGWEKVSVPQGDLGIVVSFGLFLPRHVIESFPKGALNIHPSLLPKYRGAAPIQRAILADEKETGVSIINVHPEKFDAGFVLAQEKVRINRAFSSQMHEELGQMGSSLLVKVLENLDEYQSKAKPQGDGATYAPKITRKEAAIDWSGMSAEDIFRIFRAFQGKIAPFCSFKRKTLKLVDIKDPQLLESHWLETLDVTPGTIRLIEGDKCQKRLLVKCSDDSWLEITEFHVAKKPRSLSVTDFLNGYQLESLVSLFDNGSIE